MNLSEQLLSWQQLQPNLFINTLSDQSVGFFDLQANAREAICQFINNPYCPLLMLKGNLQTEVMRELEHFIAVQKKPLSIAGVRYEITQADSAEFAKVSLFPAQSVSDNFAAKKTVTIASYFDQNQLFGAIQIHSVSKAIQLKAGLVHQLNQGVLILSLSALLDNFALWPRLKQILINQHFDWYSTHPFKSLPCDIPSYPLNLKVILLGNRDELAEFNELESELYPFAAYAELESYYAMQTEENQQKWADYVQTLAQQNGLPKLSLDGLNALYQLLVRESEDRHLINITPDSLKALLSQAATAYSSSESNVQLIADHFHAVFSWQRTQYGFLREQAYRDILADQVYVETEGNAVGQINGLSVISYTGTPLSFGEPSRISCIVQFGEGEIVDIERKSELAGNIHGKGMMIAQTCLANLLALPSQLPFSASLVFEQSYAEIDGDSASLAAFCVLTSALSDLPIPQSIAITGAIDQFGLVHAVGGVNDKIEGFFEICQRRGLNSQQGVIIPTTVLNQLSLSEVVKTAVKNQQFFIWAIDDVFQACEILFAIPLLSNEKESIAQIIHQRIGQNEIQSNWFKRLLKRKS
ncbi:MAG: Lon protease family protein [Pasteurellaceae bacterium]|nr:Lon protease family protein [Pasteurellaceae bacterium]